MAQPNMIKMTTDEMKLMVQVTVDSSQVLCDYIEARLLQALINYHLHGWIEVSRSLGEHVQNAIHEELGRWTLHFSELGADPDKTQGDYQAKADLINLYKKLFSSSED